MRKYLVLALLSVCVLTSAAAEFSSDARWITAAQGEVDAENTWIAFRKDVTLDAIPDEAVALIAADSKYWLWLNGELVVFEGSLKRGPTPRDSYYDVVDLAPYLRRGVNQVAVLLWHFGKSGFSHLDSGKSGLIFSAPSVVLLSDATWKSRIHPAYSTCGDPKPNYRLSESSIRYDASLELPSWQTDSELSGFAASAEIGRAGDAPWNALVERPIPLWRDFGLKTIKYSTRVGEIEDTLVARLPYNMHITPVITLKDEEGGHLVRLETDHLFVSKEAGVRAEYLTRPGLQSYESLGWMNGDLMFVIVPHGMKLKKLQYRQTGYDGEASGAFWCDDDYYNRFWLKGLRTLYVNMRDTFFDCPERERAQWWGDVTTLLGECFYTYDTRVHLLIRKAILELCNFQCDRDDCLHSPIPGRYDVELPAQMLASISMYGFWNYYMNTGDRQTIETAYPHVRRYLNVWKLDETGLTAERHGGWDWGDWGSNRDIRLIYAGWHYIALNSAAHMADLLGHPVEASAYRQQMAQVKKGYEACWNGTAYRHPNYKGDTDDRVQALAVISGIAGHEKYEAITQLFHTQMHASPYMEKYVMEALFMMGEGEYALERCRKRFHEMVSDDFHTTLYEGWGIGAKGYGGGTTNHAWSGGALTVIAQYLMGLSPTSPGWSHFDIRPQTASFGKACITVPTVKGMLRMSFVKKGDKITYTFDIPEGTTGRFFATPYSSARLLTGGHHVLTVGQ